MPRPALLRAATIWAAALAALAAVFMAYLNPHLVFDLATRVWACF
ncbi:conserved hypothetical protein [Rubrivivax sp. A210]|nr:hypothetical protein [Rubrivivax sp. A210]CAD5374649.1 conserved hypothetical protein [Rubrivivax sp. A210]